MLAYRIVYKAYSRKLEAPGLPGRWNGGGHKVIYCSESLALAFLENMVRRQGVGFNRDFKTMILEIPDELKMQVVNSEELPEGWRKFTDYSICQPVGDAWYDEGTHPLLKVPSAVLPGSYNYVINTVHPDYSRIRLVRVTDLIPDERIEVMLKKQER
jgi:RES domain-containing protein